MSTDYALILRVLLTLFFEYSARAGKTREELDAMYEEAKKEYSSLPDPHTLKEHEVDDSQ